MALTFFKGSKPSGATTAATTQAGTTTPSTPAKQSQAAPQAPKAQASGGVTFLKKGQAAKQALAEEEAKAEMAKEAQGRLFRYRISENDEGQVTFLDGELDEEGMLDCPIVHEHTVKMNGGWSNFVCTAETAGYCPICEAGDSKPYNAMLLTVIDHSEYTVQSGKNQGKVYKNRRKLFVAKKETMRLLAKKAAKHGGLTGCTFDVTRVGDKSAAVGSAFDFVTKGSLDEVMTKYDLKPDDVTPADYGKELVYREPDELVELGVGKAMKGPGYQKSSVDKKALAGQL